MLRSLVGSEMCIRDRDGIKSIKKLEPDIVLLDLRMPNVNGIDVLKNIREYNKSLPVVMLTTSDDEKDLIEAFKKNPDTQMATPVLRLDKDSLNSFRLDRNSGRVGGTTVVFDNNNNALYFSKEIIPFFDEKRLMQREVNPIFHHVGVYAYRPEILSNYHTWKESDLEALEGLEQLRFLENKCSIKCVLVDSKGRTFWELNNPEDVIKIEKAISKISIK